MADENSEEYILEQAAILKLASDPRFAGQDLRHHTEVDASSREAIVFKAEKGEKLLEGSQGYTMTLDVRFSSDIINDAQAELIQRAIVERLYEDDEDFNLDLQLQIPAIADLWLEPGHQAIRQDKAKLRVRSFKFPWIIKLFANV
jgi:hypothetical protein